MQHILDGLDDVLGRYFSDRKNPAFRVKQIRRWLFASQNENFEEMTNLPAAVRSELAEAFSIWTTTTATHSRDEDGTEKLLLELTDKERIECVLLRDGVRRSICISSQVGCAMGCVFCATGIDGVARNLTTGEMIEQMLRLARLLPAEKDSPLQPSERLSHLVVMGMGEPLANLDQLLPALAEAERSDGLGISPRRITISTVGLPSAIDRLADEGCKYSLAVSLHAADDELRSRLVPVNKSTGLKDILAAADRYFESSGRRLTFEYVLLSGVNDREEDAHRLATLLRGRPMLLNIIPYNPVAGLPYETPNESDQQKFTRILFDRGINFHIRRRKGAKIDAACGQLRRVKLPQVIPLT